MKCAVLGTGFIGSLHAATANRIDGYQLVAVADVNETAGRKAAEEYRCKYYSDAEEMFQKEDIDIVHVCLPTFLHEKYVLLAAQYKKHVLCEKPFALNSAAAQRMNEACEKAGVKLMVAQAARWWPEFIEIKKLLKEDAFGNIHMVYCNRLAQHPNWSTWHRDPQKSGGSLFDMNLHNIDYLFDLFGDVASVYAVGWKSPTGCWNHVISSITFQNGIKAVDEGSFEIVGNFPFGIALRMTGDKATIDYKFTAGFNIENLSAATAQTILFEKDKDPAVLSITGMDAYEAEIRTFIECVASGKAVPIPVADSIKVIKVIEAIQESLETGKVIAF